MRGEGRRGGEGVVRRGTEYDRWERGREEGR